MEQLTQGLSWERSGKALKLQKTGDTRCLNSGVDNLYRRKRSFGSPSSQVEGFSILSERITFQGITGKLTLMRRKAEEEIFNTLGRSEVL